MPSVLITSVSNVAGPSIEEPVDDGHTDVLRDRESLGIQREQLWLRRWIFHREQRRGEKDDGPDVGQEQGRHIADAAAVRERQRTRDDV